MPSHHRRRSSNPIFLTTSTTPSKTPPSIALDTRTRSMRLCTPHTPPSPLSTPTLLTCPNCTLTASYILSPTQTSPACTSCLREFKKNAKRPCREVGFTSFPSLLEEYGEGGEGEGEQEEGVGLGGWKWIVGVVWRGSGSGSGSES
ncbi:hypothetical protein HBI27_119190, partial [Parastagonospora nodorum]